MNGTRTNTENGTSLNRSEVVRISCLLSRRVRRLPRRTFHKIFEQIDEAINRYSLLLFENQQMNDAAHLEFTRRFGQLEEEHVSYYSRGEITYIGRVGNIDPEGNKVSARRIKASTGNEMWHSDSSFREIPAMYSILAAYEVPDEAGETEFASARAAYARLDQETREFIDNKVGIHDFFMKHNHRVLKDVFGINFGSTIF